MSIYHGDNSAPAAIQGCTCFQSLKIPQFESFDKPSAWLDSVITSPGCDNFDTICLVYNIIILQSCVMVDDHYQS